MKNGLVMKIIAAIAIMFVAYMVGQGTLGTRVTILETNYTHIVKTLDTILDTIK